MFMINASDHETSPAKAFTAELRESLRAAGLRPTRQRLALARLLFGAGDRHVTAESLHREARAAHIDVSVPTVYNTLHHFTRAGLLREVVVDPRRRYYDTNISTHHHLFHEGEDRLEDIGPAQLSVSGLPELPTGTRIRCVDIIIRVCKS